MNEICQTHKLRVITPDTHRYVLEDEHKTLKQRKGEKRGKPDIKRHNEQPARPSLPPGKG
jgi:hypothetical protein